MLVGAILVAHCLRDRGCGAHPVFPAPSDFRGARFPFKTSDTTCRENANVYSIVVPANAGTHTQRRKLIGEMIDELVSATHIRGYGSLRSQGRRLPRPRPSSLDRIAGIVIARRRGMA